MSDNRSYLKNLSQKKYAWMESAAAVAEPSPPPTKSDDTTKKTTPESTKKGQTSPPKPPRKKQRQKESISTETAPIAPTTPLTSVDKHQYERRDDENDNTPSEPLAQPNFKYTTFPLKGYTILPTRNITSHFVRSDTSQTKGHKAGDEAICPKEDEEWHDTIIIHPGSRNLRIGLASEAYPITVPHVLARRVNHPPPTNQPTNHNVTTKDATDALRDMRNELNWRMKNAKRRTLPNADNQVISFNSHAPKEIIPDHNDPYRVEWNDLTEQVYVADNALKVPFDKSNSYQLFYPWRNGTLNDVDYTSLYAVLGDLQTIWTSVIRSELGIEEDDQHDFKNFNAVLVVPDHLDRIYVSHLITMMLEHMKFKGVIVQQSSSCATFGAGVSSACVVDIGAQTTSIACIDEGVPMVDSRINIHFGGDDITRTFTSFLQDNEFPYHDLDLTRPWAWRLVEELKEKWCTMNEAEISVQVYDFFVRAPHQPTYKYQCKVYDEVFLAPLCLVYPNLLTRGKERDGFISNGVTDDITDESVGGMSTSLTQTTAKPKSVTTTTTKPSHEGKNNTNYCPIDIAIAQSIQSASGQSDDRLKRYFTNIIIVGGGGKISNFDRVLEDRLLSTVIARTSGIEDVEILPAPRELDPQLLVWKGASVLCKLDIAKDMWIGKPEWVECGSRLLRDRSLLLF
ncbi:hypothetical protein BC941DRAFT_453837 [Chlamydoabsidia padenii]|nr:hypothetical protein BC941DRAFT_453837 [Chlamydoabsidia padenii]